MYHDAPVEAAVMVHRHRHCLAAAAAAPAASQDVLQRIVREYQLHRVADFILTGLDNGDSDNTNSVLSHTASSTLQQRTEPKDAGAENIDEKRGCCQCRTSCTGSVNSAPYVRVALQLPDELLCDSVTVVSALQHILVSDPRYAAAMQAKWEAESEQRSNTGNTINSTAATSAGTAVSARPPAMDNPHRSIGEVRLFVLGDNTFGSCCPDEITAQHYMADCIVHFGEACMSRSTRLPVLYIQPAFHFDVLVGSEGLRSADARASPEQTATLAEVETCVVLNVVKRVATTLRRRVDAWWAEKGHSAADPCAVAPRLTVVGTYPTKRIMQAAEKRWSEEKAAALGNEVVLLDWPQFEECNGITPALRSSNSNNDKNKERALVAQDVDAKMDSSLACANEEGGADGWLVNGVRFHRLCSGASMEVQYLLFVGAAGSPALVHVLTAERYNEFHYSEVCREFLEWDSGEEETTLPVVTVVNNAFGVDVDGGENEKAVLQMVIASSTPEKSCHASFVEKVSRWLSAVLPDGVSALVTGDYVVAQQTLQRRVRQRAFNIESVRASTAIGILVVSLAIEGYYELTQQLHQLIRAYGKRSYVIYVGHLNEFKLANFIDAVDCFVAVACPYSRQSHFPEKRDNFMKPIVSPAELLVALTTSDDTAADAQYGMAAVYTTSFEALLEVLRAAVQARKAELASRAIGGAEGNRRKAEEESERWASSGALVRAGGAGGGALKVQDSSQGALARLYEREYVGLDPRIGQTPVQTEVLEGNHGIARGYAKEREEQHAELPVSQYK